MCGICGYYSFEKPISTHNIVAMTDAIKHRGPDDEGFWISDGLIGESFCGNDSTLEVKEKLPKLIETKANLALGFRRLSILELSHKGHQPMVSQSGSIALVFNGEIYNYKYLQKELVELGYEFDSNSDTEVILKGFQEWGTSLFVKLDGMFAIAIIDLQQKEIILARDRLGLKPLFYFNKDHVFAFASEIKALLKIEDYVPVVNWNGVYTNFLFQTTLGSETCFENIVGLEPGTFMRIDLDGFQVQTQVYWELSRHVIDVSEEIASKKIDQFLTKSIQEQLIADVPVIGMMSGGIDSTLIATKAKTLQNNISAFSIAYPKSEEEMKIASLVARNLEIQHFIKKINSDELLDELKDHIQHFEEPYSSLEVLLNAVEYAKNLGFKVVLSGNGADELFGGYAHTLKLKRWLFLKNFNFIRYFIWSDSNFSNSVKNYFSQDQMFDFFRQSQSAMNPIEAQKIFSDMLFQNINKDLTRFHLSETKNYKGYFEYDMKYSLSSHHVYRDDLSAMKYGVEIRYPYLSNDLVDYVSSLPEKLVYDGKVNKPLLRKVGEKILPSAVLNMTKRGFSFPMDHLMKNNREVQKFISNHLNQLKKRNFFNPDIIDEWNSSKMHYKNHLKIWQLVTFEIWYQKYFENL